MVTDVGGSFGNNKEQNPSEEQPESNMAQRALLEGWELTQEQRRFIESLRDSLPLIFGICVIIPDKNIFDLFIYFSKLCYQE